ncbi:hypothetical protein GH714_028556 [Hevea brasiliensis]|uniref:Uncharacterized protein n=1 Tax=Hevea brasiliensis TaxID=3981 RepID=A0A6A6LMI9_HEVBR|nr:hypothetical protein GH714_028556 [Hevea brasiliensis]
MTIRANAFPEATRWSEGEKQAMNNFWPLLVRALPPDVIFIADPEGSIMGAGSSIGPQYVGNRTSEMRLVGALREILAGGHLGYEEVQGVLREVLPLKVKDNECSGVSESLLSAFLIGQRMNLETDRELKAYCLAFDDELGPPPVADVRSLTHYGEPYDGNTRFFRSTLFVAAVRSCYGESSLLHGAEWMPPKGGVTEEQMLKFMGANVSLTPLQAKGLLEDDEVGFAYISQREACPSLYSLIGLREHIKKRPPLATTEKVQQFVRARGREAIVAGFYHEGYEESLLMLMKRRGVHSGLVVKGEEGALSMTTRLRSANASKGLPVNYCSGFRSLSMASAFEVDGVSRESFNIEVNAKDYGFEPTDTPRTDRSVSKNIQLGLAALRGEKGPAYDRIVLNAGMVDHLLRCDGAEDISSALDRAREAIDSGRLLYIMAPKALDYESLNENVKKVQYAVRGELYLRASELQKEGKKIIFTNVGNPHALGQKPLTFPRQVVALCQAPFLLDDPNVGLLFPADAIARAKHYLSMTSGGLGAYSDSRGIPGIRKEVAEFIGRRDEYPSDPELIFLTDGASKGVMQILNTIIRGEGDGVLMDMGPPISKEIQLVSFHTVSKGYWGECGQRGGLFEMTNIPPQTVDEIYKVASISLSPNVPAQIFMALMVNPPKPGDISYEQYMRERCMYSFPQIRLPPKAIDAAKKAGKVPDVFYCLKLLEATGISTVPGSGFGQKEGAPLKPIFTNPVEKESESSDECSTATTPTSDDARIPTRLACPLAPKKRKATLKCNYSGVREFFTPPDLETVFIRHVERATN